ncbi:exocyst complex component EXO70B1-like [Malania oleifera]|uniref:exocyst complex component EXO70B1-like n=1 Tax=Malania oleifera TaxID=397392 RepID=UPI0025AE3068|nr:exocyst complex component EXO70B1-like [Malania oleifera]
MAGNKDGDERVIAAAQQILKSLGTSKNVKEDMILILSNFDNRLSAVTDLLSGGSVEERLAAAEEVVLGWSSDPNSPGDSTAYLSAVDEILKLMEDLSVDGEFTDRAENVLHLALSKLEDEFRHALVRNTVPLDAETICASVQSQRFSLSFHSNDCVIEDSEDEEGASCDGDERGGNLGDLAVDLIKPDVIDDVRDIAERMIRAGYEKECSQVYTSVRGDVLDKCLLVLGVEKLSIEEVQKIGWKTLDEKMKKWSTAVKVVIRVLLSAEKRLCNRIFVGSEMIGDSCFSEISKGCVMQIVTFAEAIAVGQRSSERLFRILDMYDALADVLPDLQALFLDDSGRYVCEDVQGVLYLLGEVAKGTVLEFENVVQRETSRKPIQGGEIHPLTRYVMNYVKLLVDYTDSLNLLLANDVGDSNGLQVGHNDDDCNDNDNNLHTSDGSPLARCLVSIMASLESNLEDKSKLYEDKAMQCIFLMNNILYIVQKVKDSELGKFLGDHWIRKRRGQIRQYATTYLRASWTKVLSCLKDEGIWGGGSSSNVSKAALKERFKNFNLSFEEIYRNQTAWKVPDPQLREELRISISERVIPAYRSFLGRFRGPIENGRHPGKYIKYTTEDLENFVLDLFEGNSGVAHYLRKKLSG